MKMFKIVSAMILLMLSMNASALLITFDEQGPKSCCFYSEPPLDTQYAADGIIFDGGWEILNESGNFGVPALSGTNFAGFNIGISGSTNTIGMSFTNAITNISGYLGSVDAGTWNIATYLNGSLVSATSVSYVGSAYASFALSSLNADYVTITGSTQYGVLEDLSFSAVPVPAAVWLFGSGLIGLIGFAKRKKA